MGNWSDVWLKPENEKARFNSRIQKGYERYLILAVIISCEVLNDSTELYYNQLFY